jgi:hypothetical protein
MKSLLIKKKLNASLSREIKDRYNTLIEIVLKTDLKSRGLKSIDGTGGKVSITDIIAYQIGWGSLLIGWYEAGIKGKTPEIPGEGFKKWDYVSLAQHFYSKYNYDGTDKQLHKFHIIVERILAITEKEDETGNLNKIGIWPWCTLASGKQWPLSKWIRINTVAPYKRAASLIRKNFLKNKE